jgi:hypothetical protein
MRRGPVVHRDDRSPAPRVAEADGQAPQLQPRQGRLQVRQRLAQHPPVERPPVRRHVRVEVHRGQAVRALQVRRRRGGEAGIPHRLLRVGAQRHRRLQRRERGRGMRLAVVRQARQLRGEALLRPSPPDQSLHRRALRGSSGSAPQLRAVAVQRHLDGRAGRRVLPPRQRGQPPRRLRSEPGDGDALPRHRPVPRGHGAHPRRQGRRQ